MLCVSIKCLYSWSFSLFVFFLLILEKIMHNFKIKIKSQNSACVRCVVNDHSLHYAYKCDLHDLDFCSEE